MQVLILFDYITLKLYEYNGTQAACGRIRKPSFFYIIYEIPKLEDVEPKDHMWQHYPPFPLLSYFSVVPWFSTLGPCFHYWCLVYGICKWSDALWPVGRVRLFADYTISLSSLCRLIWRHWTIKMLVRYMLPSVCLRQFISIIFYSIYRAVCLQLTKFSCDDRENVYFILLSSSSLKYESLTIVLG